MDDFSQRYGARAGVLAQEVQGEIVLLDLHGETYFGLNPVGARVWLLLTEGLPVSAVVTQLMEEFDVPREQLELDVASLLSDLLERQLIEPIER